MNIYDYAKGMNESSPVAPSQDVLREALKSAVSTMYEQRRRCQRWGKSHEELDGAIQQGTEALAAEGAGGVEKSPLSVSGTGLPHLAEPDLTKSTA